MSAELKSAPVPASEAEPTSALTTVPIWLFVVMLGLLFWGALDFDRRGGWFDSHVYGPYGSIDQVLLVMPRPPSENPLYARGKKIFEACAQCHQPTGLGSDLTHAPPLVGSEWVLAKGPNRVVRIVLNGLKDPITVKGKQYGEGVMTAFKDALSDEDIAAVLTFVRQNHEWNHNASAVTPEQVRAIRAQIKSRPINWTANELLTVPDAD